MDCSHLQTYSSESLRIIANGKNKAIAAVCREILANRQHEVTPQDDIKKRLETPKEKP